MASLREIRRRISSVKSTQKITRAMKMVAAAKLRRAQEAILRTRPYAYRMRDLVGSLARRTERDAHPLLRRGGGEKIGLIVITADRGFCGAFNANIINETLRVLNDRFQGQKVELTVVGRKGVDILKRRPCTIRETFTNIDDKPRLRAAWDIIDDVIHDFVRGETAEVYCLYNEFKSAIAQNVTLEQLLPVEPGETDETNEEGPTVDYLYEPGSEEVFEELLARNMQVQMHRILNESAAGEQGARMAAMDAATENAGDVIHSLTLQYNRARQDAITKELIEVVSGAEAL